MKYSLRQPWTFRLRVSSQRLYHGWSHAVASAVSLHVCYSVFRPKRKANFCHVLLTLDCWIICVPKLTKYITVHYKMDGSSPWLWLDKSRSKPLLYKHTPATPLLQYYCAKQIVQNVRFSCELRFTGWCRWVLGRDGQDGGSADPGVCWKSLSLATTRTQHNIPPPSINGGSLSENQTQSCTESKHTFIITIFIISFRHLQSYMFYRWIPNQYFYINNV